MDFTNFIGSIGVTLVLISYFLLHIDHMQSHDLIYSVMNFLGACLILFSLFYHWNFPSAIVEFVWAIISLFGVYKALYLAESDTLGNSKITSK